MQPALEPLPHVAFRPLPSLAPVQIVPVRTEADHEAFLRFPYQHYRNDRHWVPPLQMERRDFHNPTKHPWFEFGQAELFLARRRGAVVGRVAALQDPRFNDFHKVKQGAFGFFECVDDAEVASQLFQTAAQSFKGKGLTQWVGPLEYSTNYECGLLVEGFDRDPSLMMPYHKPYYGSLLEQCGFTPMKDLWAWDLSSSALPPDKVFRAAERLKEDTSLVVRTFDTRRFADEVQRLRQVYNSAWGKNWGFVPMTEREFDYQAQQLRKVMEPELVLMVEQQGQPVAFSLTVPDANVALKAAGGRLTQYGLPWGLGKMLWAGRGIKRLRMLTLGVVESHRRRGLDALLVLETLRMARKLGYSGGQLSWTLEDNHLINRAIRSMGGQRSQTYRIYQRPLQET